jgi:hypothetical protein
MAASLSFSVFTLRPGGSSSKSARGDWVSSVARQKEYSTAAIGASAGQLEPAAGVRYDAGHRPWRIAEKDPGGAP